MKIRVLNNVSEDRARARHAESRSPNYKSMLVSHLIALGKIAKSLFATLSAGRIAQFTKVKPIPKRLPPIQIP